MHNMTYPSNDNIEVTVYRNKAVVRAFLEELVFETPVETEAYIRAYYDAMAAYNRVIKQDNKKPRKDLKNAEKCGNLLRDDE